MGTVWSRERAWDWYNSRPWLRGCNFLSSDCANRIDQWQEYGFEERLATADRELALAAETGYNSIRIILEYFVWEHEHSGFMERLERYLSTAWKHGISCMIVFGNDCMQPKEYTKPMTLGPQSYDWGYHGGRKLSQHSRFPGMGYHLLDEPEIALRHYEWVREIMETYRQDERICVWDLYNEPGGSKRDSVTMPHLEKFFEIARKVDPVQPVTSCVWRLSGDPFAPISPVERFALDNSDIISYHSYSDLASNCVAIRRLRREYGRPIVNTEWLARCQHNTVQEMFPLFYLEKIGCYNWGFVAGKYQTYEPWEGIWQAYEDNPGMDFDFTKWFHDLYRPSLHPYDPREIEIIRRFSRLADEEFARGQSAQA